MVMSEPTDIRKVDYYDTSTSDATNAIDAYYSDLRKKEIGGVYDPFGAPVPLDPLGPGRIFGGKYVA